MIDHGKQIASKCVKEFSPGPHDRSRVCPGDEYRNDWHPLTRATPATPHACNERRRGDYGVPSFSFISNDDRSHCYSHTAVDCRSRDSGSGHDARNSGRDGADDFRNPGRVAGDDGHTRQRLDQSREAGALPNVVDGWFVVHSCRRSPCHCGFARRRRHICHSCPQIPSYCRF